MKTFSVIAAADEQWGIGKDGLIPWRFPEDFKWFKRMTTRATCFMGRNTYAELAELMRGKVELLPGRVSVVFTSKPIDDPRVVVCNDINNYEYYSTTDENFFIGGTSVFEFGLTVSDFAYITAIPGDHGCNVAFPHQTLDANFTLNREIHLSETLRVKAYVRR